MDELAELAAAADRAHQVAVEHRPGGSKRPHPVRDPGLQRGMQPDGGGHRASCTPIQCRCARDGRWIDRRDARALSRLGVKWLRFHERMGVGSVMRAALRFADHLDYDIVVRVDGDGQHRAEDVDRLIEPVTSGRADVVLGSRFVTADGAKSGAGFVQRMLAQCLSSVIGQRVTDPTSGFCAMGRRAVRVLADHHPTGYAEPELRLFMNRNGMRALEVPVRSRPRLSGKTSLTSARLATAAARAVLALLVVPLRDVIAVERRDQGRQ